MPPKAPPARTPGRVKKPITRTEKALEASESHLRPERRRVSGKDRRFVDLYAAGGFKDPELAAKEAGFKEPFIGAKLAVRLSHLIDGERARLAMSDQMEVDEALRLLASVARETIDRKVQHAALRTVLQVHGVLSDKALPEDRLSAVRQVEDLIGAIKRKMQQGGRGKVKMALVEADFGGADREGGVPVTTTDPRRILDIPSTPK